ncbi:MULTISPECIES: TonB-dependent receptor [Acinetobacter]|jgi:iron complex outermembrane recepter protein|uniref:TonB-dependent receptor n=2 Tax=Acinetobacter TaxID=469 RepID=A0AAJ6ICR1_ACIJO|nr:TonB-dependent receptor [Acinetobacter johnsonii]NWK63514.1 TonB-dependent receptor [Acinetobacter sp. SwsAc3]ALV73124.1 ligand-gated channel protein [Acinetobacter johnsonii XBB1]MDG9786819.1 TonB-dependent receptor [Acinetobacter johnsonii]MDG9798402.1 TonB-dependent receptor [Acinetobacter johnsonii]MDH1240904.1 TonB-dependent receptor [Acinetobacter johnsonii]
MNRFMLPMQLTCLTLAVCTQLYAQDNVLTNSASQTSGVEAQQKETTQLAPIVMTATRSAKSIADIAGTVYSIDQAEIEKQANAGKSIADILGTLVPSLTPSSGTTSNYGMTMRGRVVQYMIDGVPQTGYRDGSRQLNSIQPSMIERIEVVSGATSIYGSGATGGIINIITKRGGQDPISFETKVGVTAGNNFKADAMAYEASQSVLFNQGALQGAFGASYTTRGEIQDSHGNRIGPEVAQTDRQDTDTLDLNGRLTWNISDEQSLSFGAQYFNDEQDSEYGPDYGPDLAYVKRDPTYTASLAAVKGMQLETQPQTERYAFNTQYENQNVLGHTLNAEAYYRNEQARWFPSAQAMGGGLYLVYQSETDIDVYGARVALQKQFDLNGRNLGLSYGIDYENEQDEQNIQMYDSAVFVASNGLNYKPFNYYAFGPDVETEKLGTFVQTDFDVTDRLGLKAGVRYERVESQVEESTPYMEAITADLQPGYQAKTLNGGKVKHDATLFNLGAVYHLTDAQQMFANFSQGSNLPDIQRMLRDVPASFTVNSQTIDPIKVNNYELGWRVQAANGLNASVTTFYNDSDKSLKFGRPNYTIEVLDTDERVYGVEGNLSYRLQPNWTVGGTMAYTRGQFKNTAGKWQELDAIRVAPLKGTAFSEWQFNNDMSLRVQALAIGGTDKAKKDAVKYGSTVPAEIKGFATMDVIANAKAGPGTVGFGVYNVWNTDYKSVYSQAVESVYGAISSLPAQGRTYGLSYTLKY